MMKKLEKFIVTGGQHRLLFLVIVYLLLSLFSGLPYFNIVLNQTNILLILFVLVVIIFKLREKFLLSVTLFFFLLALIASIFKQAGIAEIFGNLVFGLIFLDFVIRFYSYIKKLKAKKVDV